MLSKVGKLLDRVLCYFLIYRINNRILLPKNIVVLGKVKLSYTSRLKISANSSLLIDGVVKITQCVLIIENSKLTLSDSILMKSQIRLKNSSFNCINKLTLFCSEINVVNSKILFNNNTIIESYKLELYNDSLLISEEYLLLQKVNYKDAFIYSDAGSILLGSNNRIQAKIQITNGIFKTLNNVFINHGTEIRVQEKIEIGNNCFISYDVIIFDNNSHSIYPVDRIAEIRQGFPLATNQTQDLMPKSKSIFIGDNTWIGIRTILL